MFHVFNVKIKMLISSEICQYAHDIIVEHKCATATQNYSVGT